MLPNKSLPSPCFPRPQPNKNPYPELPSIPTRPFQPLLKPTIPILPTLPQKPNIGLIKIPKF